MSLDVYLIQTDILICDCGKEHIIGKPVVFSANITHNLTKMAEKAGIYEVCWRPEEHGYIYAKDIIPILEKGYLDMKKRPKYYQKYDSPNGWGMYVHFLPWIEKYLEACKEYPEAVIEVCR